MKDKLDQMTLNDKWGWENKDSFERLWCPLDTGAQVICACFNSTNKAWKVKMQTENIFCILSISGKVVFSAKTTQKLYHFGEKILKTVK